MPAVWEGLVDWHPKALERRNILVAMVVRGERTPWDLVVRADRRRVPLLLGRPVQIRGPLRRQPLRRQALASVATAGGRLQMVLRRRVAMVEVAEVPVKTMLLEPGGLVQGVK
jgi:hypothetical protein